MLKVVNEDFKVIYLLSEQERVNLLSERAKRLLQGKLENIEKYANTNIDFFTDKEVAEDNQWYFNVNKDGIMYNCIYDSSTESNMTEIERELRSFGMWRYSNCGNDSYCEVVGDLILENGGTVTVVDTKYNDCDEYLFIDERLQGVYKSVKEIEITDEIREEIRDYFLLREKKVNKSVTSVKDMLLKCIDVDHKNMQDNDFKSLSEILEWYMNKTDVEIMKIYDEYYGLENLN